MIIALSGSSGFIGQALLPLLQQAGHEVRLVPRDKHGLDWRTVEGADAVIHLAGRNIAARWSPSFKTTMLAERQAAVLGLQNTLKELPNPLKIIIIASAIGHYGETWQPAPETAPRASSFPAQICEVLESGPYPKATRVVFARLGIVLGTQGGALAKMLPAFKLGLGGPVGNGKQIYSWVSRTDAARALLHCLETPQLTGPVNVVAPHPVPQAELAQTLGQVLRRPALLPMPAFVVKLLFGEMGQELLLNSCHVSSAKLQGSGFKFQQATLRDALEDILS